MSSTEFQSRGLPLVACLILICISACTSACTTPLAPAYRVSKESREIQFVGGQTPELQIRGRFTLVNYGPSELKFVDVVLPDERIYGRKNVRVQVNGKNTAVEELPKELQYSHPGAVRIPVDPAWGTRQKRELLIEYVLSSSDDSGTNITLGPKTFRLGFRGWFVVLQPPNHVMSPFPVRPDRTLVAIRLPSNFLLLTRGSRTGEKRAGDETEYRYMLRDTDLPPFVVAGQYVETSTGKRADQAAIFWTLEPLKTDFAASAGRIGEAYATLQKNFGALDKYIRVPHVAESPELRNHMTGGEGPAAAAFPGGALVNPAALALGIESERFLGKTTHAIAHDWFGDQIYFAPPVELGLGEGLAEYATIVIDEARKGTGARRERIIELLHAYDAASTKAVEVPLGNARMTDPPEQRAISLAKAPLFFIALEDSYGEAPVRAGLAHVVSLLKGQEVGYNDIRSGIEETSGKDLAASFRLWLYEKGIPKDFRARYEPANDLHP